MTRTVLSSATKEVIIGFDQPFCVIGERINPTGRKKLAEAMKAGDYSLVEADALAQVAALLQGAVFAYEQAVVAGLAQVNPVIEPCTASDFEGVFEAVTINPRGLVGANVRYQPGFYQPRLRRFGEQAQSSHDRPTRAPGNIFGTGVPGPPRASRPGVTTTSAALS